MPGLSGYLLKLRTPITKSVAEGNTLPTLSLFQDIGGFRSNELSFTAEGIDITNKSSGMNQEFLNGRGVISLEATGEGIIQNITIQRDLQQTLLENKLRWFSIEREDGRKFIARFKITGFNSTGSHDAAQIFNITLMSSGTIYVRDTSGFSYDTGTDRITAFSSLVNPFSYYLYNSPKYFPSQIPARGSARTTALRTYVNGLTAPVNSAKLSGTPTGVISLTGPVPAVATSHTLTFAINASQYKGYSRNTSGLLNTATGTLVPNIANLNELLANASNVFASVTASNKFWLIEGVELTILSNKYTFGEYNDSNNSAKMLNASGQEVRGDSINVTGSNDEWSQAIARDTLAISLQVKNQYTFPILLLEKSVIASKSIQILDSLDSDITGSLMFAGEKTDNTNVVWNSYYVDIPLHDNETSDIKVQIGD